MTLVVSGLFVYPIKGVRAVALERATIERRGIANDRRFMLVDEQGTFVTQRTHSARARVDARFEGDWLVVSSDGRGEVRAPRAPDGPTQRVTIWRDTLDAVRVPGDASAWFADLLGLSCSLVYMPDSLERACSPKYAAPGDIASFADAYPLLLTSESSLADLNARLASPLPMDRFRPSVVVAGAPPWDEDAWTRATLGRVRVRVVKPCERCVVTTTDQRTGERGVEPLRTLATFRRKDNDVLFGQNAVPDDRGEIAVGDPVTIDARA